MGVLGSILGGAAVVLAAVFINAGYVYKESCPSHSSWHYAINDYIPYTRQVSKPCHVHSGTRLALSSVGIFKIHDATTGADAAETDANQRAADSLREATAAIEDEYARQRTVLSQVQANGGPTETEVVEIFTTEIANFQPIKNRLDRPVAGATDSQLIEARRLLSRWLALQMGAVQALISAPPAQRQSVVNEKLKPILPVVVKLQDLSPSIRDTYPEIDSWDFLRNP